MIYDSCRNPIRHLEQLLEAADRQLSARGSGALRIEKRELILTPFEAEERPASADLFADMITERMPRTDVTDLLTEKVLIV